MECQHCHYRARLPDDDLVFAPGPTDAWGRLHRYLYCRQCHQATEYVPTLNPFYLLRGRRHRPVRTFDPVDKYWRNPNYVSTHAPLLVLALRNDGLIEEPGRPE